MRKEHTILPFTLTAFKHQQQHNVTLLALPAAAAKHAIVPASMQKGMHCSQIHLRCGQHCSKRSLVWQAAVVPYGR